jgi:ornithine carbamoyltransferase
MLDVPQTTQTRSYTRVSSFAGDELIELLDAADLMRARTAHYEDALGGYAIACIFEESTMRPRVSFTAAAARLGAVPIALTPRELQLGRGETVADTARSLSGHVDAIVIGTPAQETVEELARWASVPVINAVSDEQHPCQALADLLTIRDAFGDLHDRHVAFVGDGGGNIVHSLLEACALAGIHLTVACPPEHRPLPRILAHARRLAIETGATLRVVDEPETAVVGAHAVYAGVWAPTDGESKHEKRRAALRPYRVTERLMSLAQPGAIFLHCLPAKRGEEVAASVIDGPQSAVWQQSANRLPTEEALLLTLTHEWW